MFNILLAIAFICSIAFYIYDRNRIQIVSGTIRFSDSGWRLISDGEHTALNVTNVTTKDSGDIIVNYEFKAKKVISFVACPDETLAKYGVTCGTSVGLDSSIIKAYTPAWQERDINKLSSFQRKYRTFPTYGFMACF